MLELTSFSFIPYFFLFLIAAFTAFFIPGNLLLSKIGLSKTQGIVMSFTAGMILWGVQSFIFGYLHIRWASYVYLTVALLLQLYLIKKNLQIKIPKVPNLFDVKTIILIILGVLVLSSHVLPFALDTNQGLFLCCGDPRDNYLHLSYINQVVKNLPPMEPGLAGKPITNYHYWIHIVVGELIRVYKLPLIDTAMRYIPLLLSFLICLSIVSLAQLLKLTKSLAQWILFFFIFSGDFIYLTHLLLGQGVSFTSYVHSNIALFINYPYGASIMVLLGGLNLFVLWLKTKNKVILFLTILVFGTVIEFKVNTGFFVLSGLLVLALYGLLKKRFDFLTLFVITAFVSLLVYLPPNIGARGGLIYTGFWRAQDYIVQPSFGLSRFELARRVYEDHGNWIKVLLFNLSFTLFYFCTAMGTKLGIFLTSRKVLKIFPIELNIFLISGSISSFVIGFFFFQNPGGANSMFFIHAAFVMLSLYLATCFYYWIGKLKGLFKYIFILFIVVLTIPTSLFYLNNNFGHVLRGYNAYTSKEELQALNYLKETTNPDSLLLIPNNGLDRESSYITLLSDRPSFLSGQGAELFNHGIYFEDRQKSADIIYKSNSLEEVKEELKKTGIDYIYLSNGDKLTCSCNELFSQYFSNIKITILKVN